MGSINWGDLAKQAASQTDKQFNNQLASLVNIEVTEIDNFIRTSNISNQNALKVLEEIHIATKSNEEKVNVISKIEKGVGFLLQIATKVIV